MRPGLGLSPEKTQVAALGGDERPLVRQGAKMNRIQSAVSGGFDALGGEEILDAIQGLMRAQEALSVGDSSGWRFSPVPDVRDATVARFGAARYRITFRSIRPLLQDDDAQDDSAVGRGDTPSRRATARGAYAPRTGRGCEGVCAGSDSTVDRRPIERSPAPDRPRSLAGCGVVAGKFSHCSALSPNRGGGEGRLGESLGTASLKSCARERRRRASWQTLNLSHREPTLESYREELRGEAARLVTLHARTIPWYLRQQALLLLAACDPVGAPVVHTGRATGDAGLPGADPIPPR